MAARFYEANRAVYKLLRHGINVRLEAGENDRTIFPIDWTNPQNNGFAIAEEVTLREGHASAGQIWLSMSMALPLP